MVSEEKVIKMLDAIANELSTPGSIYCEELKIKPREIVIKIAKEVNKDQDAAKILQKLIKISIKEGFEAVKAIDASSLIWYVFYLVNFCFKKCTRYKAF